MIGPIELRIPADPKLSRVVRLAASALASTGGFDVGLIDDVKLAVSEVVLALIESGSGNDVSVALSMEGIAFRIHGSTLTDTFVLTHPDLSLCRSVLSGITVSHEIVYGNGAAQIRAELRDLEA